VPLLEFFAHQFPVTVGSFPTTNNAALRYAGEHCFPRVDWASHFPTTYRSLHFGMGRIALAWACSFGQTITRLPF